VKYAGLARLELTKTNVKSVQGHARLNLIKHYERKMEMTEKISANDAQLNGRGEVFDLVHTVVKKIMSGMEYVYEIEGGQGFLTPEKTKQREKIMFGIDTLIVFLDTFDDAYDAELYKIEREY